MRHRSPIERRLDRAALIALCALALVFVAVITPYALTLHATFKTSIYDMGNYTQLFHRLLAGKGMTVTIMSPQVEQHWFSVHFSPIFYVLAPVYALWPAADMLRSLNVLLLASAVFPLYACARHIVGNRTLALALAAAYLANPFVLNAAIWDFHETAFAAPLIATAYLCLLQGRRIGFALCCAVLLMVKEHYGIAVLGFGALWAMQRREAMFGALIAAVGLACFALVVLVLMPSLAPSGVHFMFDGNERFSWLHDPFGPDSRLGTIILNSPVYWFNILGTVFFFPVRALVWLMPGAADLIVSSLSATDMMRSVYSYHNAPLIPVLIVAAAQGCKIVLARSRRINARDLSAVFAILAAGMIYLFAALPGLGGNIWELPARPQMRVSEADAVAMRAIRAQIAPDDAVAAQPNIGAHFADLHRLYPFGPATVETRWIIARLEFPYRESLSNLGFPFDIRCQDYVALLRERVQDPLLRVAYWNDPWLLLARAPGEDAAPRAEVLAAADRLAEHCEGIKNRIGAAQ